MNNLKSKRLMMVAFMFGLLITVSSSCKKDEEVVPEYVGTWFAIESLENSGVFTQYKDIVTFTSDGFTDLAQMFNSSTGKWVNYKLVNGSFTISGKIANVLIEEIGITTFESLTNLPTGSIVSYKEGEAYFNELLTKTGQPKSFISEVYVSGNELIMKTDHNGDGDYMDHGEITIFTKQ